jgi:hypothetical protein
MVAIASRGNSFTHLETIHTASWSDSSVAVTHVACAHAQRVAPSRVLKNRPRCVGFVTGLMWAREIALGGEPSFV